MPHLLIAGKLHPSGMALLNSTPGMTYNYVEDVSEESYAPFIDKADALVIRTQPLSAGTVAEAGRLKIVSRHGVGYDAVDVAALNARRIPLCVVGDVNSISVAEHAMMLILACVRSLVRADRSVRSGTWNWRNRLESEDISHKRQLILGYGRAGRRLARVADGFEMEIRAYDPFLMNGNWPVGPARPVQSLAEGPAWADVISVNAPKVGPPMLGTAEFEQVKPRVIFVNTARGASSTRRPCRLLSPTEEWRRPVSTCSTTSRRRAIIPCSPSARWC